MKTICDTNIWYEHAKGNVPIEDYSIKNPMVTNSNLDELCRGHRIVTHSELVTKSIQSASNISNRQVIGENPYMHLLNNILAYNLPLLDHDKFLLDHTKNLAPGKVLDESEKEDYLQNLVEPRKVELQNIADAYNEWADNIKNNIALDKKQLTVESLGT